MKNSRSENVSLVGMNASEELKFYSLLKCASHPISRVKKQRTKIKRKCEKAPAAAEEYIRN